MSDAKLSGIQPIADYYARKIRGAISSNNHAVAEQLRAEMLARLAEDDAREESRARYVAGDREIIVRVPGPASMTDQAQDERRRRLHGKLRSTVAPVADLVDAALRNGEMTDPAARKRVLESLLADRRGRYTEHVEPTQEEVDRIVYADRTAPSFRGGLR